MISGKILVVDDDWAICNLISRFFSLRDYEVKQAHDGKTALEIFDVFIPDLVILDVNLPDYLGYNLCEEMQRRTNVYILMLTSRSNLADKHQGFLKGADDYLTKPFDLKELEYRIKAILKRRRPIKEPSTTEVLVFDSVTIDPIRREVKVAEQVINLTHLEFNLLYFLARFPERVWSRTELIEQVWDYSYVGVKRVVDVHVGQIRRKIEIEAKGPCLIHTVRGVGYKFTPDPD
ncbi:response regulator transcription factor [Gloeocapsa sp. PCC 73106]|uniref:response regulator transcription factor n=1 Tax=Gloeocapsa sp. PCC 73106 TaxID=102232 RepID=UPI0002ACFBE3|nr:response regulator transcription factor [Gloeocapsa sp. PCC 73106]ELR96559.1 response regulator with CheY-like receiver domain and winged-helix DNA-binding domain [Gloeocapsa sp. PCC 73106]